MIRMLEEPLFMSPRFGLLPSANVFVRPAVDFKETKNDYVIEAEIPGVNKEDIQIECLDPHTLVLQGQYGRKDESHTPSPSEPGQVSRLDDNEGVLPSSAEGEEHGRPSDPMKRKTQARELSPSSTSPNLGTYWHAERVSGQFRRSFTFPTPVDPNQIKASYRDGLLSILVPKVERKGIKIAIETKE